MGEGDVGQRSWRGSEWQTRKSGWQRQRRQTVDAAENGVVIIPTCDTGNREKEEKVNSATLRWNFSQIPVPRL